MSSAVSKLPNALSWEWPDSSASTYESCEDENAPPVPNETVPADIGPSMTEPASTAANTASADSEECQKDDKEEDPCGVAGVMEECKLLSGEGNIRIPVTLVSAE